MEGTANSENNSNNNNNNNNCTPSASAHSVWADTESVYERNKRKKMTFVIFVGLPGCGKSYFSKVLRQLLKEAKLSCDVVGRDSFRYQDGVYRFVPEREPEVQKAHLESLYHLSEERATDVVIVDDANLAVEQIVGTLLAIEHEENNIIFVDFDPHYTDIHLRRLAETGHNMPRARFIQMELAYMDVSQKLWALDVQKVVVRSPCKDRIEYDYAEFCEESDRNMREAANQVMDLIGSNFRSGFSVMSYFGHVCPWLKRELFSKYKGYVYGAIQEEAAGPVPKKQKQNENGVAYLGEAAEELSDIEKEGTEEEDLNEDEDEEDPIEDPSSSSSEDEAF